jgi:hypothetical protein
MDSKQTPPTPASKPKQKQKSESELLAQLEKLQQEITINLPTNIPLPSAAPTKSDTTPAKTNAPVNKTIGVKRKIDAPGSGPPKKIPFVPRTIQKEEKIISAAPTYNVCDQFSLHNI